MTTLLFFSQNFQFIFSLFQVNFRRKFVCYENKITHFHMSHVTFDYWICFYGSYSKKTYVIHCIIEIYNVRYLSSFTGLAQLRWRSLKTTWIYLKSQHFFFFLAFCFCFVNRRGFAIVCCCNFPSVCSDQLYITLWNILLLKCISFCVPKEKQLKSVRFCCSILFMSNLANVKSYYQNECISSF